MSLSAKYLNKNCIFIYLIFVIFRLITENMLFLTEVATYDANISKNYLPKKYEYSRIFLDFLLQNMKSLKRERDDNCALPYPTIGLLLKILAKFQNINRPPSLDKWIIHI